MDNEKVIDAIDDVILYLYNHKDTVIERLFGTATKDYQAEWHARDTANFWGHLDRGNRHRLLGMAKGYCSGDTD